MTIFLLSCEKNHKLPPLFYLDHNELFPLHREWNEVIFMIYFFFNMFSFLTNLSVLLLFTYISIQYIELCNVCQVLVTNLLYSSSVWCHTQYIIYFCFLGQTVQTLIWSHRKGLTNTAKSSLQLYGILLSYSVLRFLHKASAELSHTTLYTTRHSIYVSRCLAMYRL